jgi:hypothetical protein
MKTLVEQPPNKQPQGPQNNENNKGAKKLVLHRKPNPKSCFQQRP